MSKSSQNINKGFTLLEMIVSLGIFSIIAVIAVGSLVRITSLNRQAQSLQAAMNNVNYILESFSREMRFGSSFNCTTDPNFSGESLSVSGCNSGQGNKGILFKSTKTAPRGDGTFCPLIHAYWFEDNGSYWDIKKSQQTSCGESISRDSALSLVDAGNVVIESVDFAVITGNLGYSRSFIRLTGHSGIKEKEINDFDIWTQVSQRIRD